MKCKCGCGGEIEFKRHHKYRQPQYINGHQNKLPWNKGKKCPQISNSHKGELNPAWKGGITTLVMSIRTCEKYINWRTQVFGRDNFTCRECGKRGDWLEAHHIKSFASIVQENNIKTFDNAMICNELWGINNGITLCIKCHNKTKEKIC